MVGRQRKFFPGAGRAYPWAEINLMRRLPSFDRDYVEVGQSVFAAKGLGDPQPRRAPPRIGAQADQQFEGPAHV